MKDMEFHTKNSLVCKEVHNCKDLGWKDVRRSYVYFNFKWEYVYDLQHNFFKNLGTNLIWNISQLVLHLQEWKRRNEAGDTSNKYQECMSTIFFEKSGERKNERLIQNSEIKKKNRNLNWKAHRFSNNSLYHLFVCFALSGMGVLLHHQGWSQTEDPPTSATQVAEVHMAISFFCVASECAAILSLDSNLENEPKDFPWT